ncbi:Peroxidase 15, partial [Mucuna pruriens]
MSFSALHRKQSLIDVVVKNDHMLIMFLMLEAYMQGCDASILLNDTDTIVSEQNATPNNNSIRGLDVVNQIKTAVENVCPGIVSCADILALIFLHLLLKYPLLWYVPTNKVPLGRRDSLIANIELVDHNIPSPSFDFTQLKSSFAVQGLNTTELVTLAGAHTFGRVHCSVLVKPLYNFSGTGNPDPTLNTAYLQILRAICPNGGPRTNLTSFDPTTPDTFDNNYYSNLQVHKGLLHSDQVLFSTTGANSVDIVNRFVTQLFSLRDLRLQC